MTEENLEFKIEVPADATKAQSEAIEDAALHKKFDDDIDAMLKGI